MERALLNNYRSLWRSVLICLCKEKSTRLWRDIFTCGEKDVLLPLYLPMEMEILLSTEKEMDLEEQMYFCLGKKDVQFPVERGILNCLWRENLLGCGERHIYL